MKMKASLLTNLKTKKLNIVSYTYRSALSHGPVACLKSAYIWNKQVNRFFYIQTSQLKYSYKYPNRELQTLRIAIAIVWKLAIGGYSEFQIEDIWAITSFSGPIYANSLGFFQLSSDYFWNINLHIHGQSKYRINNLFIILV